MAKRKDEVIAIIKGIVKNDRGILARRDDFASALKEEADKSPDVSRDLSPIINAIVQQSLGELFYVADSKRDASARADALKKARDIMKNDMSWQEDRVEFVADVFEYALDWDKPILYDDDDYSDDDEWNLGEDDDSSPADDASSSLGEAWDCRCGRKGNTQNFCVECGRPRSDGEVSNEAGAVVGRASSAEAHTRGYVSEPSANPPQDEPEQQTTRVGLLSEESKSKPLNTKLIIAVVAAVLIAAGALFFNSMSGSKQYEAKSNDFVAVSKDISKIIDDIGSLGGDSSSDETRKMVSRIEAAEKSLDKIHGEMEKAEPPEEIKNQKESLLTFIERDKNVMSKMNEIFKYDEFTLDPKGRQMLTDKAAEFVAAINSLSSVSGAIVNGQDAKNLVDYNKMSTVLQGYVDKKINRDKEYGNAKMQEYQQAVAAKNEEKMKSKELVFLTDTVQKSGNDILIYGTFYNGTKDVVSSVKGMLVDVTLKNFDKEVLSIKDFAYEDTSLKGFTLDPKKKTNQVVIRLAGQATGDYFNNFDVNIHKIHWTVRRQKK